MNDLKSMFKETNLEMGNKLEEEMKSKKLNLLGLKGLPCIVPLNRDKKDGKKRQKWVWVPFNNPARLDGVQFYHWQREEHIKDDYEVAKLNVKINIVSLKDDEYNEICKDLDPNWTLEETKYLWELCRDFDLRFIVIQDRYSYKGKDRTIEELKDRYYSVSKALLESRKQYDHPIMKSGYCYSQEIKRRACLERIINKNQDNQIEKELVENLMDTNSKIEKIKQNEALEKKLLNHQTEVDIGEINFEQFIMQKPYSSTSFIYLRSNKMTNPIPINEKIQKKVEFMLKELAIPEKLTPTERVESQYEKLKNNLIVLSSLRKHFEKKEKEKRNIENIFETYSKTKVQNQANVRHQNNVPRQIPITIHNNQNLAINNLNPPSNFINQTTPNYLNQQQIIVNKNFNNENHNNQLSTAKKRKKSTDKVKSPKKSSDKKKNKDESASIASSFVESGQITSEGMLKKKRKNADNPSIQEESVNKRKYNKIKKKED